MTSPNKAITDVPFEEALTVPNYVDHFALGCYKARDECIFGAFTPRIIGHLIQFALSSKSEEKYKYAFQVLGKAHKDITGENLPDYILLP